MNGIVWRFGENSERIVPIEAEPISVIPKIKEEMREQLGRVIDELVGKVFGVSAVRESADGETYTACCKPVLDRKAFLKTVEALGQGTGCDRHSADGEGHYRLSRACGDWSSQDDQDVQGTVAIGKSGCK